MKKATRCFGRESISIRFGGCCFLSDPAGVGDIQKDKHDYVSVAKGQLPGTVSRFVIQAKGQ